ncbi:hypothetical protein AXG93_4620s1800 [Marchantia polymorpha subsp. ruderalis]|uniref:Uncharacterized protein n=1 Tax=Marchantia polymorpha subsp. ruderalis TaxID=1480154 RepID=A0A176VYT3_MARPO|nr:hypothetical protein AXG93_4620s1800 [Marchantia polymorpha subsp. ruderalis]
MAVPPEEDEDEAGLLFGCSSAQREGGREGEESVRLQATSPRTLSGGRLAATIYGGMCGLYSPPKKGTFAGQTTPLTPPRADAQSASIRSVGRDDPLDRTVAGSRCSLVAAISGPVSRWLACRPFLWPPAPIVPRAAKLCLPLLGLPSLARGLLAGGREGGRR